MKDLCLKIIIKVDNEPWQRSILLIYSSVLQRLRHGRSFSLSFLSAPHKAPYHVTSSFRVSIMVWKQPRRSGNRSACCSLRGQLSLIWRTPPSQLFKNCPVQHWRRLQETRACLLNPFLDPIIRFHFHGRSCWVCYGITHAKKRDIFSGAFRKWSSRRRELLARRAGYVFPEPRVVFRLNTVWKHCGWLARGARQS